ncbi:hypothetical protein [Butyricimonas paravirosa]|jgi:hypothetical protein|uniref:hypothetical protein n=1 Tax=Butyricimonas paravirosa TaxID=1472417 RepID=UPI003522E4F9
MEPITTAAIIGAGASLAGSGVSAIGGGKMNRKTRKWATKENQLNRDFSAEQAELARQWQEDFYNQYSSPEAMRKQYEAAGMNPYLAMENSGGSVGSAPGASSGPSAAPSNSWNPVPINLSGVSDAINSLFGNMKTAVETDMEKQFGSDLRKAQIFKDLGGNWAPLEDVYQKYQRSRAGDYAGLQDTTLRQNVQGQKIALENSLAQGAILTLDADAKRIMNQYIEPQQQAELMAASARWFDMMQGGILKGQQVKQSIAETIRTYAQAQGQKIDNKIAESTADSLIKAMKAENEYNRRNFFIGAKQLPFDYGLRQQERYYRFNEMRYMRDTRFNNDWSKGLDTYITPVGDFATSLLDGISRMYLGSQVLKSPKVREIGFNRKVKK